MSMTRPYTLAVPLILAASFAGSCGGDDTLGKRPRCFDARCVRWHRRIGEHHGRRWRYAGSNANGGSSNAGGSNTAGNGGTAGNAEPPAAEP